MVYARMDKDSLYVHCGNGSCRGRLATILEEGEQRVWQLLPGFHRDPNGIYRQSRHAANQEHRGYRPKDRRPVQHGGRGEAVQIVDIDERPEIEVSCPRCGLKNVLSWEHVDYGSDNPLYASGARRDAYLRDTKDHEHRPILTAAEQDAQDEQLLAEMAEIDAQIEAERDARRRRTMMRFMRFEAFGGDAQQLPQRSALC